MSHKVVPIERLEFQFSPRPWTYADANRGALDAHFAAKQRTRPAMWNGRVLAAFEHSVGEGVSRGAYLETDFASFDAWRDWGHPPAGVLDCFSAAVVHSSDGAFLTGVMGAHTANEGRIYFPCGTPDLDDIAGACVDLEGSALRELKEETGLDPDELEAVPGWLAVITGPVVLHAKLMRAPQSAEALRRRILQHLASQPQPELADIHLVRSPADLDRKMPLFVSVLLRHIWG
jgi:8-oxo-dGTP pyrophosphatase MutT (NUDIX family)